MLENDAKFWAMPQDPVDNVDGEPFTKAIDNKLVILIKHHLGVDETEHIELLHHLECRGDRPDVPKVDAVVALSGPVFRIELRRPERPAFVTPTDNSMVDVRLKIEWDGSLESWIYRAAKLENAIAIRDRLLWRADTVLTKVRHCRCPRIELCCLWNNESEDVTLGLRVSKMHVSVCRAGDHPPALCLVKAAIGVCMRTRLCVRTIDV